MTKSTTLEFTKDMYTAATENGELTLTLTDAGSVYDAHRPDTFNAKQEKAMDSYRQDFVAAAVEGAIDMVATAFKKDKEIHTVRINAAPSSSFQVEATTERSRQKFNPKTKEPVMSYGSTSVRVKTGYRKVGTIRTACDKMVARIKSDLA